MTIEGRDVTNDDKKKIKAFLDELWEWESLIKAGLNLVSELKIIQVDQTTLQNYHKEFGREKYRVNVEEMI